MHVVFFMFLCVCAECIHVVWGLNALWTPRGLTSLNGPLAGKWSRVSCGTGTFCIFHLCAMSAHNRLSCKEFGGSGRLFANC
eukprot:5596680-Amphidinium_carterae.1